MKHLRIIPNNTDDQYAPIVVAYKDEHIGRIKLWLDDSPEREFNSEQRVLAKDIVRACNSHDELVEALKAMVNAYGKYTVCPEDGSPTMLPDEHRAFELAYTALENAEGK